MGRHRTGAFIWYAPTDARCPLACQKWQRWRFRYGATTTKVTALHIVWLVYNVGQRQKNQHISNFYKRNA